MKLFENISIRKMLYNKRIIVLFSIIMAFILWLNITINQKNTMDRTITNITVSVNLENTFAAENQMNIIGDISQQKFSVTVRGPSYLVSSLTASDLNLYASAASVDAPGEYRLDVAQVRNSYNNDYEILNIIPSTLKVSFDYIDTKEFTIEPIAVGVNASEGLIAENGLVSGTEKDTVTITGPRTTINKIQKVVANAQVNKTLSSSETFDADIVLLDVDGKTIKPDNLTLSANKVKVTVPISKKATVPVVLDFSNMPLGFDKSTIKYSIDYPTVTVIGTPETVEKTKQVTLSAIDLSTVSNSSNSFDVSAKLPEGVRILENIDHFTVKIDTTGYLQKTINVNKVNFSNIASGLSVSKNISIKNVKVFGPASMLSGVTSANIEAEINLTDKKSGEHTVTPTFKISGHNNCWIIGTYNTTVTIK